MPNNLLAIKRHLETCNKYGSWSKRGSDPIVVWRDGGFVAVERAEDGERTFDINLSTNMVAEAAPVVPAPGMPPLDVEPVKQQLIGHTLVDTPAPNETKIVAEFEDPTEEKPVAKKPRRKKVN